MPYIDITKYIDDEELNRIKKKKENSGNEEYTGGGFIDLSRYTDKIEPQEDRKPYVSTLNTPITVDNTKEFANVVGDITGKVLTTAGGSAATFGGGVMQVGDMMVDWANQRDVDSIFERTGEAWQATGQELFKKGAWEEDTDWVSSIKEGNIGEAVSKAMMGSVRNSAQLATLVAISMFSGGTATVPASAGLFGKGIVTSAALSTKAPLMLIASSAAGGKYSELDDREDLSLNQKLASGFASGAIEYATETLGSLRWLRQITKSNPVVKEAVVDNSFKLARSLLDPKMIAKNAGEEAIEEFTAEFANELSDTFLGISDKTLPEVIMNYEQYINAAGIGAVSGGAMSMGSQLANMGNVRTYNERGQKAQQVLDYIENNTDFELNNEAIEVVKQDAMQLENPEVLISQIDQVQQIVQNSDMTMQEASEIFNENAKNINKIRNKINSEVSSGEKTTEPEEAVASESQETVGEEEDTTQTTDDELTISKSDYTDEDGVITKKAIDRINRDIEELQALFDETGESWIEDRLKTLKQIKSEFEAGTKTEETTEEETTQAETEEQQVEETEVAGIDLNTASKEELMNIKGIGSATADRIIEQRQAEPFTKIEDLTLINGIGVGTLKRMDTDSMTVGEIPEGQENGIIEETEEEETEVESEEDIDTPPEDIEVEEETEEQKVTKLPPIKKVPKEYQDRITRLKEPKGQHNYKVNLGSRVYYARTLERAQEIADEHSPTDSKLEKAQAKTNNLQGNLSEHIEAIRDGKSIKYRVVFPNYSKTYQNLNSAMNRAREIIRNDETFEPEEPPEVEEQVEEVEMEQGETEEATTSGETEEATEETVEEAEAVDLNTSSKEELMSVKGIGESTADKIIKYREQNLDSEGNAFNSVDDLSKVPDLKKFLINRIDKSNLQAEQELEMEEEAPEPEIPPEDMVNLNTATAKELQTIRGIGRSTSETIVEHRKNKKFSSVEDLLDVKGIGQGTLDKIDQRRLEFEYEEESVENIGEPKNKDLGLDEIDDSEEPSEKDLNELDEKLKKDFDNRLIELQKRKEEINKKQAELLIEHLSGKEGAKEQITELKEEFDKIQKEIEEIKFRRADMSEQTTGISEQELRDMEDQGFLGRVKTETSQEKQSRLAGTDVGEGSVEPSMQYATRKQIEDFIRVDLGLPLRYGKLAEKEWEAQYDAERKVIRTRDYSNLEVTAHEIGHHIVQKYGIDVNKFNELLEILKGEGLETAYPNRLHYQEGAGEFFKYYFTNPSLAALKAPKFTAYFEELISYDENFADKIKYLQELVVKWNDQSADQRLSGAMSRTKPEYKKILSLKDKINKEFINQDIIMEKVLEKIGLNWENIPTLKNPVKRKRLYASINDKVDTFLTKQTLDPYGRPLMPSLVEILSEVEEDVGATENRDFGDFEVYALARHALEREANYIAKQYDKDNIMYKMIREAIETNNVQRMASIVRHEQIKNENVTGRATGIDVNDIVEVIEEMQNPKFDKTLKLLNDYQHNLIDHAVENNLIASEAGENIKETYNFHLPLYRQFGEEHVFEGSGGGDAIADLPEPIKSAYGSTRIIKDPLRSIVRDTVYILRQGEKNMIALNLIDAIESVEGTGNYSEPVDLATNEGKENVVTFKRDGIKEARVVHPELYDYMKGLDKETADSVHWLFNILRKPNDIFKQMSVIAPSFWIRNLFRDEMREINYRTDNGADKIKLFSSLIKGFSGLAGLSADDVKAMFTGVGGARAGFTEYLKDIENPEKMEELFATQNVSRNPLDWLAAMSKGTEDVRRRGFFVQYLEGKDLNNMTDEEFKEAVMEAGLYARGEVLEDYGIKGEISQKVDRYGAAFMSAGFTGARHMFKALKNPVNIAKSLATITLPSIALWLANRDKEVYQEMPEWRKMFFFNFITDGGTIISLPKPFSLGYLFGSVPEAILNYSYQKDAEALEESLKTAFTFGMPNMQPSAYLPYIELAINRRFDTDSPIVPETEQYLPAEQQYGNWTSEPAKFLGSIINVSPRKIDHLIRGQFTAVGSAGLELGNYAFGANTFKETALAISGAYSDPFISPTSVNRIYEERDKNYSIVSSYREKRKNNQPINMDEASLREAHANYRKLNRITSVMSKYRELQDRVQHLDINKQDIQDATLFLRIQNINLAREYRGQAKINPADIFSREEIDVIRQILNSI